MPNWKGLLGRDDLGAKKIKPDSGFSDSCQQAGDRHAEKERAEAPQQTSKEEMATELMSTQTKSLRIKGILCRIEQDEHGFVDVHIDGGNEPTLYPEWIIRGSLDEKN